MLHVKLKIKTHIRPFYFFYFLLAAFIATVVVNNFRRTKEGSVVGIPV